jgi:hypothetical protein
LNNYCHGISCIRFHDRIFFNEADIFIPRCEELQTLFIQCHEDFVKKKKLQMATFVQQSDPQPAQSLVTLKPHALNPSPNISTRSKINNSTIQNLALTLDSYVTGSLPTIILPAVLYGYD